MKSRTDEAMKLKKRSDALRTLGVTKGYASSASAKKKPGLWRCAFDEPLRQMQAIYKAQVGALVEKLRGQITRGEFTNLGEQSTYVRTGSFTARMFSAAAVDPNLQAVRSGDDLWLPLLPGLTLLETTIRELPLIDRREFIIGVLACSPSLRLLFEGVRDDEEEAAVDCLAIDAIQLFETKYGLKSIRLLVSQDWTDADMTTNREPVEKGGQ